MKLEERIMDSGYEEVVLFKNYDYESAFIGISHDNRAIYDYEKMVEYLVEEQSFEVIDAIEWIDYNTVRALSYGDNLPIILYSIE